MCILRERGEQESDLAHDWWRLEPHTLLSLEDGRRCLLLYSGQPGGPAGPDVRDAVLRLLPEETTLAGDVEFHLRTGDWFTHGHQSDPRYNQVILHVVRHPDSRTARREDGTLVPTCSLLDPAQLPQQVPMWPCQRRPLAPQALTSTLLQAGLQRFVEKSHALYLALAKPPPTSSGEFHAYDLCLLPALAEALGYGRDRAFFRAAGLRLLGLPAHIPEPLGRTRAPAPLDASRLRVLHTLTARWRSAGAWQTLSQALLTAKDVKTATVALRAALHPLNRARADILIVNVILPFAGAVAELENHAHLAARTQQIYLAYPGLTSNRITRMMSTQLQLVEEPAQTCLQQGLHHIYVHTCRTKTCQDCLCGGQRL